MRSFSFRYKKPGGLFWRKSKVSGYNLQTERDRMLLFLPDGGLIEIPQWSTYMCKLGIDWVLATKDQMEKESGKDIKVSVVKK